MKEIHSNNPKNELKNTELQNRVAAGQRHQEKERQTDREREIDRQTDGVRDKEKETVQRSAINPAARKNKFF